MIVKKLRLERNWSQEQLAELCGLNVRTIQRVESGNKASIETLNSLASVFEVDVSTLTEEVTVIDKNSEDWKGLPLWFRLSLAGSRSKRSAIVAELAMVLLGFVSWLMIDPNAFITPFIFLFAYVMSWVNRYGDKKKVWS
ncbi:helix-turn-helix domain-containing protein [Gilvimarinus algae]|uniref:Helix-turn-helix transcriptional regulator n=1 Tax=Gilvimarinus algae TaxID=3058037 RepID=A0ABT8TJP4_9GAMM|nr:helix-turn-helix transcriptional regulator [Gilvimarinus sp. SDUM040014]MDO3383308.1 helix-turn-helix transcriptional regulator [Gilvimarinus sp. SDUM040014]